MLPQDGRWQSDRPEERKSLELQLSFANNAPRASTLRLSERRERFEERNDGTSELEADRVGECSASAADVHR